MSHFTVGDLLDVTKMNSLQDHRLPLPVHGLVNPASYDPQNATISVTPLLNFAAENTIVGVNGEITKGVIPHIPRVQLLTSYLGQQSPPQGGERCLLIPTEDGSYAALVYTMYDDTPGAPAGEWWAQRYDRNTPPASQTQFLRIQNDGATRIGGASKVAVISPVTNLGAESLPGGKGVVTIDDLQAALNAQQQKFQQAINQLAQIVAGGQGVPPPTVQGVTAQGSQSVFASE